jgi:lambda family phage portal protein
VVVHDFDKERANQHRGVGILTSVLSRFKMLHRFDQAALQSAVLRALVGFFLKSPYDAQQIRDAMEIGPEAGDIAEQSWYQGLRGAYHDVNPVMMGGVRMPALAPGESIESVRAGDQAVEFETFEHAFLRCISSATGQTAEEITGDYSKVNYSSARAASLTAWRTLIRRRTDFAAGYATPVYGAWLEEALESPWLKGLLPRGAPAFAEYRAAYARALWIGPGKGWVDPVKERQGEVLGLDAGFGTLSQVCAEVSGSYWREVLEQRAVEEAAMKKLNLTKPDWAGGTMAPASQTDERPVPQ